MDFKNFDPEARDAERMSEMKAQMRAALDELDTSPYPHIIAARMTRICADIHDICAAQEWRRGYRAARIGGGVDVSGGTP